MLKIHVYYGTWCLATCLACARSMLSLIVTASLVLSRLCVSVCTFYVVLCVTHTHTEGNTQRTHIDPQGRLRHCYLCVRGWRRRLSLRQREPTEPKQISVRPSRRTQNSSANKALPVRSFFRFGVRVPRVWCPSVILCCGIWFTTRVCTHTLMTEKSPVRIM